MNFDILFNELPPIPHHAVIAGLALVIGGYQLWAQKGGMRHRVLGYVWVAMMLFVGISGFFIHKIKVWGDFSPIHLLSAFIVGALFFAVRNARKGNIRAHRRGMISIYIFALVITGLFTFFPGRIMFRVFFGGFFGDFSGG